jgi:YidC/Oxa1 family membrane protein insertase
MQLLQPKVKELQKKYGHDRERLTQETMALYKDTGTNPFSSCLPLIVQMPIFLSLFRLLSGAAHGTPNGILHADGGPNSAQSFANAQIFGGKISSSFVSTNVTEVKIIAIFLVLAMTATTQRQLMSKNMPDDALSGPYAQQQKMLLYILPLVFAVGGIAFPIGVLFYWTTSNLWTMGQQFYVIRNNPAPNTAAFRAKQERDATKGVGKGQALAVDVIEVAEEKRPTQRQQPKKQSRQKRRTQVPKNQSPSGDSTDQGEDS